MTSAAAGTIRTPDQRVRVFISSTIHELADERLAARAAISQLRLTPVFFEAGARPHPPRDLYAAYLAQSHVFLAIYGRSYGWVSPGAEISGLEDEYRLSGDKPRLIYVKRADERDPRLNALLAAIEGSDTACYQLFSDAAELGGLIENDLSMLMSETFESALARGHGEGPPATPAIAARSARRLDLPVLHGNLIGRDADRDRLAALLLRPDVPLVTLIGAGGSGKTSLAAHVSYQVQARFTDGVVFVPLAPVTDWRLVGATIAESLGVQDSGRQPIDATLAEFLADKDLLLILDNFEQVTGASRLVSSLLARAPRLRVLVTSRTSLHVRGEHLYHLSPLAVPADGRRPTADELMQCPATALFLERARAVNPSLALTPENIEAIAQICRRLDGLPLAIELAAARTRFFEPAALTARLRRTLDLVSKGHRDLPERQQTLRAAIEWSYQLLSDDMRRVFRQLGVFRRSWTLDAADVVLGGAPAVDIEEVTERLIDVSLIQPVLVSHTAEPRFNMLQTVHEYALEALLESDDGAGTTLRYADYFRQLCLDAEPHLWGATSEAWLDKLEYEYQNGRAAFHIFVDRGLTPRAWEMLPCMVVYWTIRGGFSEGVEWLAAAGVEAFDKHDAPPFAGMPPAIAGRAMTMAAFARLMLLHIEPGFRLVRRAQDLLRETTDVESLAFALVLDGCYGTNMNRDGAQARCEDAETLVERVASPVPRLMFLMWSYSYYAGRGRRDVVAAHLEEVRRLATELEYQYILGSLQIIRYNLALLDDAADYEALARESAAVIRRVPETGYRGLRAAAMVSLGFARMMQRRLAEAREPLQRALEFAREAGEMESHYYTVLAAAQFLGLAGHHEPGLRLLGAVDQFRARSGYGAEGAAERQYQLTWAALNPDGRDLSAEAAYVDGRKLRLDEAGRTLTIEDWTVGG